ncbi:unnamed protein product [Closterium sp. NIES-54]
MIHAAAPHFLWPFVVRYATHQLNLWPHVSEPETSPTLRWPGEVGDASAFRVWGALSLVRDTTAGKFSPRTLRCVFLGFPTDAPPWQFYHPASRRVLFSQDITFDELACFYRLHPHASSPVPSPPLFLVDPPPLVDLLEVPADTSGPAEGGDSAADDTVATRRSPRLETPPGFPPRPSSPPLQPVAMNSGAAGGGDTGGVDSGGAGPRVADSRGAGSGGAADSGGAASPSGGGVVGAHDGAWSTGAGGVGAGGAAGARGTRATGARRASAGVAGGASGAGGAGSRGAGGTGAAGARGSGVGGAGGTGAAGAGGARVGGTGGTGSAGAGGTGAGGNGGTRAAGAGGAGAGGAGATSGTGTAPRRPFFYPQPQSSLPPRVFRHFVRFLVFRLPLALLRLSCVLRLASHSRSYCLALHRLLLLLTLRKQAPWQSVMSPSLVLPCISRASAQPLAPCLSATDLAYTALDGGAWRCVGVWGLGRALPCPRYHHREALSSHSPLRLPWLPHRRPALAVLPPCLAPRLVLRGRHL